MECTERKVRNGEYRKEGKERRVQNGVYVAIVHISNFISISLTKVLTALIVFLMYRKDGTEWSEQKEGGGGGYRLECNCFIST
jgi:hypothetical protein